MFCRCCGKRRAVVGKVICKRCSHRTKMRGKDQYKRKTVKRSYSTFRQWVEKERRRYRCRFLVASRDFKISEGFQTFDAAWEFACNGADQPPVGVYVVGRRPNKKKVEIENPDGTRIVVEVTDGRDDCIGQIWPTPIGGRIGRRQRERTDELAPTAKEQTRRKQKPKQKKGTQHDWRKDRWLHYQIDGAYRPIQVDVDVMLPQSNYTCPQWSRTTMSDGSWPVNMVRDTRVGLEDVSNDGSHVERFHEIMKG